MFRSLLELLRFSHTLFALSFAPTNTARAVTMPVSISGKRLTPV
jgi:hypothetical protein